MEFSRQEYWNGLTCPLPGDLPNPGIKPVSLTSPALASRFFTIGATWEAHVSHRDLQCMVMNATYITLQYIQVSNLYVVCLELIYQLHLN